MKRERSHILKFLLLLFFFFVVRQSQIKIHPLTVIKLGTLLSFSFLFLFFFLPRIAEDINYIERFKRRFYVRTFLNENVVVVRRPRDRFDKMLGMNEERFIIPRYETSRNTLKRNRN